MTFKHCETLSIALSYFKRNFKHPFSKQMSFSLHFLKPKRDPFSFPTAKQKRKSSSGIQESKFTIFYFTCESRREKRVTRALEIFVWSERIFLYEPNPCIKMSNNVTLVMNMNDNQFDLCKYFAFNSEKNKIFSFSLRKLGFFLNIQVCFSMKIKSFLNFYLFLS